MTTEKLAYSVAEAAEALSLSKNVVRELVSEGRIRVVRVGRRVLVPRWALDEFLQPDEAGPQDAWKIG